MHIDTYGAERHPCVLLLHTMFTTGALFKKMIPVLQNHFFLVVPTLDGYDPANSTEYPGADPELEQIEAFLHEKKVAELAIAAGSSLGAMLVWRLWQRGNIPTRRLILDSPPFGWPPAVAAMSSKNFCHLVSAVRAAPSTPCIFDEQYGEFGSMMRHSCLGLTENTIRSSCETCFGPQLPGYVKTDSTKILLVYGDQDRNYQEHSQSLAERKDVSVIVKPGYGHCGLLMRNPLEFTQLITEE